MYEHYDPEPETPLPWKSIKRKDGQRISVRHRKLVVFDVSSNINDDDLKYLMRAVNNYPKVKAKLKMAQDKIERLESLIDSLNECGES